MKKLHTKKRFNNKKGISMVLAIALVAVLFLTTTSFLSIAMLQQNETGTSLNSRQAYVSSKSALDIAEEFLNDNKLTKTLPDTVNASRYYVFYYDSTGNVKVAYKDDTGAIFTSAEAASNWIKNHSDLTIIGNAYVKITYNGGNNYTITAVGNEEKYNNTNGGNTGDLSVNVEMKKELVEEKTPVKMTMYEKKLTLLGGGSGDGSPFLMLGDQASYTLLRSITGDDYRTIGNNHMDKDGSSYVYMPKNEASSLPITTNFPLVFNYCVDFLSESGTRSKLTAYNNGIYLLGKYSGEKANGFPDLCFVTNTGTYGATLECKYLVIGGNIACKSSTEENKGITLKYSGTEPTKKDENNKTVIDRDNRGIVIYFPEESLFTVFDNDGNVINKSENGDLGRRFSAGYYWVNIPDDTGVDLATATLTPISTSNPHYTALNGIDMYSSMLENGSVKNMHSAYEEKLPNAVSILHKNGEFNTEATNSKVFSTSQITTHNNNWDDYYTYCAPSKMPSTNGYYEMYAGKEFSYLWYNIKPMTVKSGTKMSIRSNNIVLSIGPDTGEKVYKIKYPSHETYANQTNLPSGGGYTIVGTYTSAGTNKIIQESPSASFCVKPYWNETSFTLNVVNDFEVVRKDGITYTVKAGEYKDIPAAIDSFDPKKGLDLFSNEAKAYFELYTPEGSGGGSVSGFSTFELGSSVGWVTANSINTGVAEDKLDRSDKYIKFEASNGGTFSQDNTYKAKAISCKFGNTVYGNGATLQADVVNINAPSIESNGGKGLFFDTYSGYDATDGSRCVLQSPSVTVSGILLRISRDGGTDLKLSNGMVKHLDQGYYYFKDQTTKFNILSADDWKSTTCYFTKDLETPFDSSDGMEIKTTEKIVVDSFEGKYF